jgi:hypothetical protein
MNERVDLVLSMFSLGFLVKWSRSFSVTPYYDFFIKIFRAVKSWVAISQLMRVESIGFYG